jgi:hypothetical protein
MISNTTAVVVRVSNVNTLGTSCGDAVVQVSVSGMIVVWRLVPVVPVVSVIGCIVPVGVV